LDYSKLIELCNDVDNNDNIFDNNSFGIVITISNGKNKILNTNKTSHLFDITTELKIFKTKDKKMIEYFPRSIINDINNNTVFNDMINKKKELMSKGSNNEDFNDIEFI
jgi:hypothetical protein